LQGRFTAACSLLVHFEHDEVSRGAFNIGPPQWEIANAGERSLDVGPTTVQVHVGFELTQRSCVPPQEFASDSGAD